MAGKQPAPITPETRVSELLDSYPELEQKLIELSPAFAKLSNPVLRRTVARVATLRHAAKVGQVNLGILVNELRRAAGISDPFRDDGREETKSGTKPGWFAPGKICRKIDIRPLIEAGQKPISQLLRSLEEIPQGQILQVTAPFVPAPLIDRARSASLDVWWTEDAEGPIQVYFFRPTSAQAAAPDDLIPLS